MPPPDDNYRLRILKRCRVAGMLLRPGQVLWLAPNKLKIAHWLCDNGCGRPNDERTAVDVALFEALKA